MLNRVIFLTLFITLSSFAQVNFQTAMLYQGDINSKIAFSMQEKGAILVDIRTKREFETLRAKDSINIPLFHEQKGQRVFNKSFLNEIYTLLKQDLNKEVILICRSGSRTKLGANLMAHNGFTNVYNVKYGFQYDWVKVKLPVEK